MARSFVFNLFTPQRVTHTRRTACTLSYKNESSASLCVHELGSSDARSVMLCFYRGRNNGNNTEETEFVSTPRNARGPEGVQAKIKNPEFHYTLGETLANVPSTPYLGVYLKAQSHIPSRMSSAPKHEKFWSVHTVRIKP